MSFILSVQVLLYVSVLCLSFSPYACYSVHMGLFYMKSIWNTLCAALWLILLQKVQMKVVHRLFNLWLLLHLWKTLVNLSQRVCVFQIGQPIMLLCQVGYTILRLLNVSLFVHITILQLFLVRFSIWSYLNKKHWKISSVMIKFGF